MRLTTSPQSFGRMSATLPSHWGGDGVSHVPCFHTLATALEPGHSGVVLTCSGPTPSFFCPGSLVSVLQLFLLGSASNVVAASLSGNEREGRSRAREGTDRPAVLCSSTTVSRSAHGLQYQYTANDRLLALASLIRPMIDSNMLHRVSVTLVSLSACRSYRALPG